MNRRIKVTSSAIALGAVVALTAGCGTSLEDVPLPGGANTGSDPINVSIQFEDVLDLVRQGTVKVNGLPAGRIDNISLAEDGWTAQIEIELRNDVALPANAVASVQQTNLLGEKFVELSAPEGGTPHGKLGDGDVIPLERTRTATNIEQVLGALSLVLNGGGLSQIQSIVTELNSMTNGRENQLKDTLNTTADLINSLNRQRDSIVNAIDGVNELSANTREQTPQIEAILDELPEGVRVLDEQRPQFVEMLRRIDALGQTGTDLLMRSREDLIADLRALRPVLQELSKVTPELVDAAAIVPTYPFPDSSADTTIGSSSNVFLNVDAQVATLLSNLGVGKGDPQSIAPTTTSGPYSEDPRNPWAGENGPDRRTTIVLPLPLFPEPQRMMSRAVEGPETPGLSDFSPTMEHLLEEADEAQG